MPTYTQNLGATLLEQGQANAHAVVNEALAVFDKAIAGRLALALTANRSLTGGESTNAILHITSTTGAVALTVQAVPKTWDVINDGSHTVTLQCAGQSSPPTLAAGTTGRFACDGTGVRRIG